MKILKNRVVFTLLSVVLLVSCSEEQQVLQEEQSNDFVTSSNRLVYEDDGEVDVYHFIRFDIKNFYSYIKFFRKLEKLVGKNHGAILTKGMPIACLEGDFCNQRNIVIQFPSRSAGESFFAKYQQKLGNLSNRAADNLTYSVSDRATENLFNEDIDANVYLIANADLIDPTKYVTEYLPGAAASLAAGGGSTLSLDFVNPVCLIGDCPFSNVLLKFESLEEFENWYFSEEYQALIPIRQASLDRLSLSYAVKY